MIEAVTQHFLNPTGLAALLALIPLIIFYLVKPKPQEEVMPSMAFFTEEKKKGKISNALETIKRNKLLLLHILFILTAAAAIANPLIRGLETQGNSVIVLDTSASMNDNRQSTEEFALQHLGEKNTVITAAGSAQIQMKAASAERARSFIKGHQAHAESTDLRSALQLASNYAGKIVIASDMSHTATQSSIKPVVENLAAERTVKAMDLDHRNSHAFTELKVENGAAKITVQNFLNRNRTLEVSKPGENREVTVGSLSTETFTITPGPGTHEITLPPDELALDNKLYISIPEKQLIKVSYLGDESRYFRKAVKLINSTQYSTGFSEGTDAYFIGEGFELDEAAIEKLKSSSAAKIYEVREGVEKFTPVQNFTRSSEKQVEISAGITSSFRSTVNDYDVTGQPLATPKDALVLAQDGKKLLYNVEDEKFGQQIAYPIFWKNILHRMTDLKTASQLNIKTGTEKKFEQKVAHKGNSFQGYTEIDQTGFYWGSQTYAANLLNPSESAPYINKISSKTSIGEKPGKDPARKYLAALLALVASLELAYLSKRGETK